MGAGDNFVADINDALATSAAGLIVFSQHAHASPWVRREAAHLASA